MNTTKRISKSDVRKILKTEELTDVEKFLSKNNDAIQKNTLWTLRKSNSTMDAILSECRKGEKSYTEIAREFNSLPNVISRLARTHGSYRLITAKTVKNSVSRTIALW